LKKRNRQVSFRSFGGDWPPPQSSAVFTGQTQNFLPSPRVLDFVVRQKLLLLSGRVVTWYGPRSTCSAGLGLGQQIFFCIALHCAKYMMQMQASEQSTWPHRISACGRATPSMAALQNLHPLRHPAPPAAAAATPPPATPPHGGRADQRVRRQHDL
jgi:hypothetical protein